MAQRIPHVEENHLVREGAPPIEVGSAAWFGWLSSEGARSFAYQNAAGSATVRREWKGGGSYWYAYRTQGGKLRKVYLGKSADLSAERLRERVATLNQNGAVRLYLLGPPALYVGPKEIGLTSAKAFGLLAYLASHELLQSRELLIGLLWPESAAMAGRKNMRNLLWLLGTIAGTPLLESNGRLALHPTLWVDLREFDQLARSLPEPEEQPTAEQLSDIGGALGKLYRGPLLAGVAFDDAPELDLWLAGERERLHQAHLAALGRLVEVHRAAGRWGDLIAVARAALVHDPLQEGLHRTLMEAQARLGQRSEALRQYEALRALLDRELGMVPLVETEELREAIIGGTIGPAQKPMAKRPSTPRRPATPYVGRRAELRALDELWAEAERGGARVALLVGEAGIGKSRLWQTWAERLRASARVLEARCLETTRTLPFAPLVELLRGYLLPLSRALAPSWLADLSRLLPELRDSLPHLPQPPTLAPAEEQRRVFEALVQSLQLDHERPLVLFVDDLHWADRATLDWLGYLVHRAHDMPFLLVGSYRAEEASSALAQVAGGWARGGISRRLTLERLNRAETEDLIAALGGDLGRADALHCQSAGNPYFLRELLQSPPDHLPAALADVISERLDQLPETARQVIQAAAILQPHTDFAALWRTSGRSESETLDALDLLLQRGLLVERGQSFDFNHPLIAHVVDIGLSGARRALLHRRAAEAWLAAGQSEGLAGRLANHYREAGDAPEAARYAEVAGAEALALGATVEAVQFYLQAVELEPTPDRLYGLGLSRYWQGDLEGARSTLEAAHGSYMAAGERRGAAHACLELARAALSAGHPEDVVGWVILGRDYLVGEEDPTASAIAAYLLGTGIRTSGQSLAEAENHLNEALTYARAADARALLPGISFELGNISAERGDLTRALAYFQQTIDIALANNDVLHQVLGYNNAAYHAILAGDLAAARRDVEAGLLLIEERGMELGRQWLYSTRGELALAEGQWDSAEGWFERGIAEAERYGNRAQIAGYRANLARVAWGRGDLEAARELLAAARSEVGSHPPGYALAQIDLWLAALHRARGNDAAAEAARARAEATLAHREYALLHAEATRLRDRRRSLRNPPGLV